MNNYNFLVPRSRGKTLLIVEGNHEKNILFRTLFLCFPELKVDFNNIWIYGTNIYKLHAAIIKEYDEDWQEQDIDLPLLVGRNMMPPISETKYNFTNIYIVFDYERHDPSFSEEVIEQMQSYFTDAADVGQLYINYPMIESYRDVSSLPDTEYIHRTTSAAVQSGSSYKDYVNKTSCIDKYIGAINRISFVLSQHYNIIDDVQLSSCLSDLLNIDSCSALDQNLPEILSVISEEKQHAAICQMKGILRDIGYPECGQTYFRYMRSIFQQLITMNLSKARFLANNREGFQTLVDYLEILKQQNFVSNDVVNGFIHVLNTCILLVPDYSEKLLTH